MLTVHRLIGDNSQVDNWIGPAPWITVSPPGPMALWALARGRRVIPLSNNQPYPLVVHRVQGTILEDVDRNRYLDFTAGLAICSTGHCHPQIVRAIEQQASNLLHPGASQLCYGPMVELAEKLTKITPGEHTKSVLFTNSAAEAVDAAIKMTRWHTQRHTIIKIKDNCFIPPAAPEKVAAIIVDPISIVFGNSEATSELLPALRAFCDEHSILLVVDETRTGMGRTGKMFCCEHFGVAPDILILAEGSTAGIPFGAAVAREPIMHWPRNIQGLTSGGNPISCAAVLATIELLEKHMLNNVARLCSLAMHKLERIVSRHKHIASPRGLGLLMAVDVVKNSRTGKPDTELRDRIITEAFSRGLLLAGHGPGSIRFTPPLGINRVQLEVGLDVFDEAVATVSL